MTNRTRADDRSVPELFAVPLEDFVRARNALAARLKEAGRTSEAAEVQRLRKPTPAVWSVNQLARRRPEKIRELIDAVEALRRAHFKEAGELAQATERHRAVLQDLVDRTQSILDASSLRASPDVLRRISNTLSGSVADPNARAELLQGRLTEEREAPGFEVFTGPRPAARKPPPPARPATAPRAPDTTKAHEVLRLAQAEAKRQQRRAQDLERIAAKQQRAADAAASAAQDARERLTELDRQAAEERRAAEQAAQAARQARQDAERAAQKAKATY
jgi:hypothetical protein